MTDKEKAEKYIMREDVVTENDRVPVDNGYSWRTVSFEDEVKRVYLDGLEEGRKEGILGMLDKCEEFRHKANELEEENTELKAQIEKMKKFCDCEYCINVTSGDEFTVENTNKTLCEYCMENNKKLWKFAE